MQQIINIDPYVQRLYESIISDWRVLVRVKEWSVAGLRVAYRLSPAEADQLQGLLETTPEQLIHPHWR